MVSENKIKAANLVINVLSNVSVKNDNPACRGLIYEPKVPKKLQNN